MRGSCLGWFITVLVARLYCVKTVDFVARWVLLWRLERVCALPSTLM